MALPQFPLLKAVNVEVVKTLVLKRASKICPGFEGATVCRYNYTSKGPRR